MVIITNKDYGWFEGRNECSTINLQGGYRTNICEGWNNKMYVATYLDLSSRPIKLCYLFTDHCDATK